jgi:hypothetical protein
MPLAPCCDQTNCAPINVAAQRALPPLDCQYRSIIPVVGFRCNHGVKLAHDASLPGGVITCAMRGCYSRQSTCIKMAVVAMQYQHDVDRRHVSKGNTWIVNALWSDET